MNTVENLMWNRKDNFKFRPRLRISLFRNPQSFSFRIPHSAFRIPHSSRRHGSVLIMVVALLVLIALIATAMLSTTRNDRYASVQHQQNVQIDMLVEGAKQIALSKILDDTYGIANSRQLYRPGDASDRASRASTAAPWR